jgi:DNA-binding SARP family transcriptional activator
MAGSEGSLPHLERLLHRLNALEAPLIELRGWPGSGRTAVLEAFLARHGALAWALPAGILEREDWLRQELAERSAARWLVAWSGGDVPLTPALRWLRPGPRLLIARPPGGLARPSAAVVGPQDLLLTQSEVAALAAREAPLLAARKGAAAALWAATDGWYRPLRLAMAAGFDSPALVSAQSLARLPAIAAFLRHEVLEAPPEPLLRQLRAATEVRPTSEAQSAAREAWGWIDRRGLWLSSPVGDRLPSLLAAILREELTPAETTAPAGLLRSEHHYEVCLLGEPLAWRAEGESKRPLVWTLRRAVHIVAFLASAPKLEASRAELLEAVWPGEDEATAVRRLHPTLSALRRTLEGGRAPEERPLLLEGGVYRLNPDCGWRIDVRQFQDHIETGREHAARDELHRAVELWQQAWQLYRGGFLQGHHEEWIDARRERYRQLYVDMLRDLGDALARLERNQEAVDAYRTMLLADPLQERVHLALMRLHARQGRRDLVRRQYERLRTVLHEELGVEPMPLTAREYLRLMA